MFDSFPSLRNCLFESSAFSYVTNQLIGNCSKQLLENDPYLVKALFKILHRIKTKDFMVLIPPSKKNFFIMGLSYLIIRKTLVGIEKKCLEKFPQHQWLFTSLAMQTAAIGSGIVLKQLHQCLPLDPLDLETMELSLVTSSSLSVLYLSKLIYGSLQ